MIGRIKCLIGRHDWRHVEFVYGGWLTCARCWARR